jgi:hypothetical protein
MTYTMNATETTSAAGPIQIPRVAPVAKAAGVVMMPFYWGGEKSSTMKIASILVAAGTPPKSPSYQNAWKEPLKTIFLDSHWRCGGGDSICAAPLSGLR